MCHAMRLIHNPDFPIDEDFRRGAADLMAQRPALPRPLVIIGGYHAPRISAARVRGVLSRFCRAEGAIVMAYPLACTYTAALASVRTQVAALGLGSTPVDAVGVSMGGLLARSMAGEDGWPVERLFTLATPHRGACLAEWVRADPLGAALRPGSRTLAHLDALLSKRGYELTCYATLRDWWVGAGNTAPPGMLPYWLDVQTPLAALFSHFMINSDSRLMADIAARLVGHTPLARRPTAPPKRSRSKD
jgi:pimeloyl-ACP methyl ester carboxylesterase